MDRQVTGGRFRTLFAPALLVLATIVTVVAAIGWLYWLRGVVSHWPGPRISQALPLDALSSRDSVPVVVFIVIFAIAGSVLGTALRRSQVRPRPGIVVLSVIVWIVLYVANAISLFTVRQIPFLDAWDQALKLGPAYLATAIACICSVIFAQPEIGRVRGRRRFRSGGEPGEDSPRPARIDDRG
jgi:hypothetical protein